MRRTHELCAMVEAKTQLPVGDSRLSYPVMKNAEHGASSNWVALDVDVMRLSVMRREPKLSYVDPPAGRSGRAQVEHESQRPPDPDLLHL